MKIILTSSGFDINIAKKIDFIVPCDRADISIGVIINAKQHKLKEEITSSYLRHKAILVGLGYVDVRIIDLDTAGKEDFICDILYIIGGNAFYLLDSIRRNSFFQVLKLFLKKGNVAVGESAGSYVLCPNIEMASWKHHNIDTAGLSTFKALNLVPFLVTAHYNESLKDVIENNAKKLKIKTYALKDGQAIFVEN